MRLGASDDGPVLSECGVAAPGVERPGVPGAGAALVLSSGGPVWMARRAGVVGQWARVRSPWERPEPDQAGEHGMTRDGPPRQLRARVSPDC
jgi:hypothetical protein